MTPSSEQRQANQTANSRANMKIMQNDIAYIRDDIADIKKALQENYVTNDRFAGLQRIVFGAGAFISALLVTTFGYIISRNVK